MGKLGSRELEPDSATQPAKLPISSKTHLWIAMFISVLGEHELGLGSKTGLKQGKGKIHFTEYISRISLPAGSLSQTSHS